MAIVSWNVRGLNGNEAMRQAKLLIKYHKPDLLFLMETKLAEGKVKYVSNKLGFEHGFEVPRVGLGGGIMVLWKDKVIYRGDLYKDELQLLFTQIQDTAQRVAKVQFECKVQIDVENFANSFRSDIMEAMYAWAKGSKFYQIMELSQVFEGSLIRAFRRLEEVLQQLILVAKSIGDTELEENF